MSRFIESITKYYKRKHGHSIAREIQSYCAQRKDVPQGLFGEIEHIDKEKFKIKSESKKSIKPRKGILKKDSFISAKSEKKNIQFVRGTKETHETSESDIAYGFTYPSRSAFRDLSKEASNRSSLSQLLQQRADKTVALASRYLRSSEKQGNFTAALSNTYQPHAKRLFENSGSAQNTTDYNSHAQGVSDFATKLAQCETQSGQGMRTDSNSRVFDSDISTQQKDIPRF